VNRALAVRKSSVAHAHPKRLRPQAESHSVAHASTSRTSSRQRSWCRQGRAAKPDLDKASRFRHSRDSYPRSCLADG
jgi:hypothetical protein